MSILGGGCTIRGRKELVFTDSASDANIATSWTFTGLAVDAADPSRYIYVGVACAGSAALSGVTINGSAATRLKNGPASGAANSFWGRAVATGTTVTVVVTASALTGGGVAVYVWAGYNLDSNTPTDTAAVQNTANNGSPASTTIDVLEAGYIMAVSHDVNLADDAATWVGVTEINEYAADRNQSGAWGSRLAAQTARTVSVDWSTNSPAISLTAIAVR